MNELEKYIKKNRVTLDTTESVDVEKMWKRIDKTIHGGVGEKKEFWLVLFKKMAIAASFILIGGVAMWLFMQKDNVAEEKIVLRNFYPEWAETAQKYQKTIALKEANIPYDSLNSVLFTDILKELQSLEEMHKETLKDLPRFTQNDRVLDALMRYYERKIQILERISNEYKKNKRHEKRNEIHI